MTTVAADVLGAIALSVVIFGFYAVPLNYERDQLWAGLAGFLIAWGVASHSQELYRRSIVFSGRRKLLIRTLATCAITFGLVMVVAFGLKLIGGVSRLWLLTWAACSVVWVIGVRISFRARLQAVLRRGNCVDRVVVLSESLDVGHRYAETLRQESGGQIGVAGVALIPGRPTAPSIESTERAIRSGLIDRVFIAGFGESLAETNLLLSRLAHFCVDATVLPDFQGLRAPLLRFENIGVIPTVTVASRPLTAVQQGLKRAEDIIVSSAAIALTAPLLVLVAIAIKLDSRGPVFYAQDRAGFHDRSFRVWKFRTMRHAPEQGGPLRQTCQGDSRVTRVGRFLRRSSFDELPQLFNVLRGEMSVVGPRPHAVTMTTAGLPLHALMRGYESRHRMKPGITGWAQINGSRGQIETEEQLRRRVALDCYYIENWSLVLDAWIVLRTFRIVFFAQGAH